MDLLMRRREMMLAAAGAPGEEYTKFNQSVIVKNGKSATISVGRIAYNSSITFYLNTAANISAGSTATYSDLVTDGNHFWLSVNTATNCTYNGVAVTKKKSGYNWQITIPDNYDPTIPFIFT